MTSNVEIEEEYINDKKKDDKLPELSELYLNAYHSSGLKTPELTTRSHSRIS